MGAAERRQELFWLLPAFCLQSNDEIKTSWPWEKGRKIFGEMRTKFPTASKAAEHRDVSDLISCRALHCKAGILY